MENIVKIPSQQSSFNATNNLVDIVIPGNSGVYDLSACFVTIDTRLNITTTLAGGDRAAHSAGYVEAGEEVQSVHLAYSHGAGSVYNNTAAPVEILVRNCSMMSASRGKVEDVRRSDVLRATMKSYLQDLDDVEGASLTGTAGPAKGNPFVFGRHAQLFGEGDVLSKEQTHEIRIYLRDVFEACKVDAWDSAVYGNTHIHFELNLANIELKQVLGDTADAAHGGGAWALKYHNRAANTEGPQAVYGISDTLTFPIAVAAVTHSAITMLAEYESLDDSPFWCGQCLQIEWVAAAGSTGTAGAGTVPALGAGFKWAIVKSLTYDEATKKITLEFGGDVLTIANVTGGNLIVEFNVKGKDVDAASLALATGITYDSIELTAVRRTDIEKGPAQIQYSQFLAQSDQWSNALTLNRSYFLPARTTNCLIVLPAGDANGSNTVGSARLSNYRFTVNGESVTNRAVQYMPTAAVNNAVADNKMDAGSALHYDLISNTMMNMGVRYSSLQEALYDQLVPVNTPAGVIGVGAGAIGYTALADCPRKRCYMIALPIPMSEDQTQLTVELEGSFPAGVGQMEMYSYVVSQI